MEFRNRYFPNVNISHDGYLEIWQVLAQANGTSQGAKLWKKMKSILDVHYISKKFHINSPPSDAATPETIIQILQSANKLHIIRCQQLLNRITTKRQPEHKFTVADLDRLWMHVYGEKAEFHEKCSCCQSILNIIRANVHIKEKKICLYDLDNLVIKCHMCSSNPLKIKWNTRRLKAWISYNGLKLHGKCYVCTQTIRLASLGWERGHVQASSMNGTDLLSNIRCICVECNQNMSNQNLEDYAIKRGFTLHPIEPMSSNEVQKIIQQLRRSSFLPNTEGDKIDN